ncbi:MAG: DUF3667 domain-containing protein [Rhizobiales bacterium]|nr:DUF3667 domain-containing protein [Rhizobacter sp.]
MPDTRCLNCDAAFTASMRFCPSCSQRTDTARLAVGDLVRELMHSFLNVERGPLAMLRSLVTRPGGMARDYVEGRRRRYYGPFATLVVLVGVTALIINVAEYKMLAQDGYTVGATELLQRHFNLLLLLQLPLLGLICAIVFRSARLTLPEHLVLVAYALSFRTIALIATIPVALTVNASAAPTPLQVAGFWVVWYFYFAWAATQFYPGRASVNGVKGLIVAALGHASLAALVRLGTQTYEWAARL